MPAGPSHPSSSPTSPDWADSASLGKASAESAESGADPFQPLVDRGIAPEVWEARGYVPYYGKRHPLHDACAVKDALAGNDLSDNQARFYAKTTDDARDAPPPGPKDDPRVDRELHEGRGGGLLMHKHSVPGCDAVLPQLRPDYAVELDKRGEPHRHDRAYGDDEEGLAEHIREEHEGHAPPRWKWHRHPAMAKYLIAPTVKVRVPHDHATDPLFAGPLGDKRLRDHLNSRQYGHKGEPREGEHPHRRELPGQHVADRLDIHPWALERLQAAARVYFCIEGTPKADAILTRILVDKAQASVFDVPSVTLWDAPDLKDFAREYLMHVEREPAHLWQWTPVLALGRKLVVIVADADWHENRRVVRQALRCREYLRELGVVACVAAPPAYEGQKACRCRSARVDDDGRYCRKCGGYFKGVDDFLAAGGKLDDLLVIDREAPCSLALYAHPCESIKASLWTLGKLMGSRRTKEDVLRELQRHIDSGILKPPDGPLTTTTNEYTEAEDWEGKASDWPTFVIREDWRYVENEVRLGDYRHSLPPTRQQVLYEEFWKARADALPNSHHLTAAINATAKRTGYSMRTIQGDAKELRSFVESFDRLVRDLAPDDSAAAAALGVSVKTIQRMPPTNGAAPALDHEVTQKLRRYLGWDRSEIGGG